MKGPSRMTSAWLVLLFSESVDARTWYVRPDSTGDAFTIQAAVDSAQAGDEVLLAPGTYTTGGMGSPYFARVVIFEEITLRGEAGAEATILDWSRIYCENAGAVRIEGLTIRRGSTFGSFAGGGFYSTGETRPTLADCIIEDCVTNDGNGGGIACANATITNCIVRNCEARGERGGGIFCENSTVTNCKIFDNLAGFYRGSGGGIHCTDTVVSNCIVRGNVARGVNGDGGGGGIAASGSGTIADCWIEGNTASGFGAGGGGAAAGFSSVQRCVFLNNVASAGLREARGGGLSAAGEVSDCVFVGNRTVGAENSGGALYGAWQTFSATRCTVLGNSASGGTAAVAGVLVYAGGPVSATIVAWNEGLGCGGIATFSCCDVYGNSGGDTLCGTDGGGNFSADPQFCAVDPASSLNFALQSDSPCAPGNHPDGAGCGLIGAAPAGCGTLSIERTTWSRLKLLYR